MSACECSSSATGCQSNGMDVTMRCGCDLFLPGKKPFCYIVGSHAQCPAAFESTDIPGAAWLDCTSTPPQAPPGPLLPPSPPLRPHGCCPDVFVTGAESFQPTRCGRFSIFGSSNEAGLPVYANRYGAFLYFSQHCHTWQIGPSWRYDAHSIACGACNQHNQRSWHCPGDSSDLWLAWNSTGRRWVFDAVQVSCVQPADDSPPSSHSPALPSPYSPPLPSSPSPLSPPLPLLPVRVPAGPPAHPPVPVPAPVTPSSRSPLPSSAGARADVNSPPPPGLLVSPPNRPNQTNETGGMTVRDAGLSAPSASDFQPAPLMQVVITAVMLLSGCGTLVAVVLQRRRLTVAAIVDRRCAATNRSRVRSSCSFREMVELEEWSSKSRPTTRLRL